MRLKCAPAIAAILFSTAALPVAAEAASDTATFTKTADWGSGFVGEYAVSNNGAAALSDWKVEFDLAPGMALTNVWSAKSSAAAGHHTIIPEDWTRSIPAGGSVRFGLEGTYSGSFEAPRTCRLNGQPCDGSAHLPPDTRRPSVPTGLEAVEVGATSIRLAWQPSRDNVGVARYELYRGAQKVADAPGSSHTVFGLNPGIRYRFRVRAADAAGNRSPMSSWLGVRTRSSSTPPPGSIEFAPYHDMTLQSKESVGDYVAASGVRSVSLGFIVSGAACEASWGGFYGIGHSDEWFDATHSIDEARAAGAEPIISFGGAANQELARTCTTVSSLAAQYQSVIDRYGVRSLDFDIEGADQSDAVSLERRMQAIAQVQQANAAAGKPVRISLTLPVMPTGLTSNGLGVVRAAGDNGVDVDVVNVMAMDYFDPSLPLGPGKMGDYAVQAAQSLHAQLAVIYPQRSDAELWRMVGVTPMIGINDNPAEIFTIADAQKLADFAVQNELGRLAIWSSNRDQPCPGPRTTTENTCSGTAQAPYGFSAVLGSTGG